MELEQGTNELEVTVEAPEAVTESVAAPEVKTEFETQEKPVVPLAAVTAPPEWVPDYKFKAAGAEHEIPEMYRGLAKDQKSLDEIKRLHEKAFGLDSLEQNRNTIKKQLADTQPRLEEYDRVTKNFTRLSHFVQNKDFDSFFSELKIPERALVEWMQHKVSMAQNPELAAQYDRNRQLSQQQYDNNLELNQHREVAAEYERSQSYNFIHQTVAQTAQDFASLYDEKMGEGAFVDSVIDKGLKIHSATGKEPDLAIVIDLVKSDLQKLGLMPAAGMVPKAGVPVINKPSIPVIKAGGQSPIKQPIRTMEDLKKISAAFQG